MDEKLLKALNRLNETLEQILESLQGIDESLVTIANTDDND